MILHDYLALVGLINIRFIIFPVRLRSAKNSQKKSLAMFFCFILPLLLLVFQVNIKFSMRSFLLLYTIYTLSILLKDY